MRNFKTRTAESLQIKNNVVDLMKNDKFRRKCFIFIMLLIPVVHFLTFYVYANFSSILLAFQRLDKNGQYYFTLKNFKFVFDSFLTDGAIIKQAISNSLIFFLFNSFVILPLSLFFSFFFYKKIKLKSFFRFMFFIPSIISGVAVTTMYKFMLSSDGPIGEIWKLLSQSDTVPLFFSVEEYALKSCLIYMLLTGFSGGILLIGGAMSRIPEETVEASLLDGVGMWRELFQITLPMIWPTLSTIIITTAASILSTSGPILLLTGGAGNTYDISYYIFVQVQNNGQYSVAAALGIVLTVCTFPIVMVARWAVGKVYKDVEF